MNPITRRAPSLSLAGVVVLSTVVPRAGHAQTAMFTAEPATSKVMVTAFADGAIRAALTGKNEEATASTGAVGVRFTWTHTSLMGRINVVSTVDTIRENGGAFLLTPGGGKAAPSALIDITTKRIMPESSHMHLHGYLGVASSLWSTQSTTEKANVVATGLLIGRTFRADHEEDVQRGTTVEKVKNVASIGIEAGLSARLLGGDINEHDSLRVAVLGADRKNAWGPEVGFYLQVNRVHAAMQYYHYWPGKHHVRGLTRSQVVFALAIQADIFTLPFTDRSNEIQR